MEIPVLMPVKVAVGRIVVPRLDHPVAVGALLREAVSLVPDGDDAVAVGIGLPGDVAFVVVRIGPGVASRIGARGHDIVRFVLVDRPGHGRHPAERLLDFDRVAVVIERVDGVVAAQASDSALVFGSDVVSEGRGRAVGIGD